MCGRYSVIKKKEELEARFNARVTYNGEVTRYNIAPTQAAGIIHSATPQCIQDFRWGLIPFDAKESAAGARYINARAETLLETYPFSRIAGKNRCLIPADGFYEWKNLGKLKVPHRFSLKDESLFAFAGVWDAWADGANWSTVFSFSVITVQPNELVTPVHNRMPAILLPEHERLWLDASIPTREAVKLLQPYPGELMKAVTVSSLVNSPANDSPAVIEEAMYNIGEQGTLF